MATQVQYPAFRLVSKQTKPGTIPGTSGGNRLVCVSKGGEVRRITRQHASELVANGWHYAQKSTYKAVNRGR